MMQVHHAGKMGDLIYALPVIRALARRHGPVRLTTSGLCWQMVPILWEQPYFEAVEMDCDRSYKMADGVMSGWDYFKEAEGINLSPQPLFYEWDWPVSWTMCYAKVAGLSMLEKEDYPALPSLINHRRWMYGFNVRYDGVPQPPPNTMIVAPETESLTEAPPSVWQSVIDRLSVFYEVVLIGKKRDAIYQNCLDLRGKTTVSVLAKMIAESRGFIGAHSLPWHLARHSETPAVCLQEMRDGLRRCIPVDTLCHWMQPEEWKVATTFLMEIAARGLTEKEEMKNGSQY